MNRSDPIRGFVMLIAAAFAVWEGFHIHHSHRAALAFVLGAFAVGMAVWHFLQSSARSRS